MKFFSTAFSVSCLFIALFFVASESSAQSCFDDLRYDDGTFENAFGTFSSARVHFVMRLDPPPNSLLERVCLCWIASEGRDLTFDLLVWDSDGPGGAPGTLLGRFEDLQADNVPFNPPGAFYQFDLADRGLIVPGPVYIGPQWHNGTDPGFFLCADFDGPSTQPGYWDSGGTAGNAPPDEPLGVDPPFEEYVALGIRGAFAPLGITLSEVAEIIVPGFRVDASIAEGPTTLLGLRNTSTETLAFDLEYHGNTVTEVPRRVDPEVLAPNATLALNVRDDLSKLDPDGDEIAEGLFFVRRPPEGELPLEGDYYQVDFGNDFATGERMVRPADFCLLQEIRFLDFGDGTELRILLDRPLGETTASFSYEVYNQAGDSIASGEYFTAEHLSVVPVLDLVPGGQEFGTVVFDFAASSGGWASAKYSAFGKFSVELNSACRD